MMSEQAQRIQDGCTTERLLCLSEVDFNERLVQFFGPFVSVKPMDWTCIYKSLAYFAPFFKFKRLLEIYFDYIFVLFEDLRVTDKAVIKCCVLKYCRFKMKCIGFPLPSPQEFPYEQQYRLPDYECSATPLAVGKLLCRPSLYMDPMAVMRLLRYVAPSRIDKKKLHEYVNHVVRQIRQDPFLDTVDIFQLRLEHDPVGRRRLKLISMVLDFVLHARIRGCRCAIRGLRLLFEAIPDPYVTWIEISDFLMYRLIIIPRDSKISYIKNFWESCAECFPECLRSSGPRSLKHLARCKVRRHLHRATTLPHGVWTLGLPRELEDYVLLQSRKDQYRPDLSRLSSERMFVLSPVPEFQFQETSNLGQM